MAIDREKVLAAAQKYVEKKKYDRAVIEYQKVIQEDPNDARTLLKIGDLQSKMEAYGDAVGTYERVGKFYASQGFALKAIAVYKQIREIIAKHVPQLEETYSHITPKLAELYQQLGLTSDALAALDEVATRLQRQNRDPEAIRVFRKIVELDPTNPLPHLRLAEALSRAKDADGAVAEFAVASGQLVKLGRRDDALKVVERLLHHRQEPTHARVAAELYLARNQPNDGLQALSKLQICFQANPRDLDTLGLLAKAFDQIGQAAKAIEVHKEMARIARDTGRTDLFRELVTKLQKLAPNDDAVRQLAMGSMSPQVASSLPPPEAMPRATAHLESRPPLRNDPEDDGEDGSYEDVGDGDIEQDEQPLELSRRSRQPADDDDVVVESSIEVAEEVGDAPLSSRANEQAARILADAASFRRARFHAKAIETLRIGLEVAPRSVEVHEMLRDVLLETGQTGDAIAVMLALAGLLIDGLDGEAAARTLQEVLGFEPQNQRATEMLRELGYELVEEPVSAQAPAAPERVPPMRPEYHSQSSYDPEAPLPSYDLEEIGPEDVALRSYSEPSMRTAPAVGPAADARLAGRHGRSVRRRAAAELPARARRAGQRGRVRARPAARRRDRRVSLAAGPRLETGGPGAPAPAPGARIGARGGRVLHDPRPLRRRADDPRRAARAPAQSPAAGRAARRARRTGARDAGRLGDASVAVRGGTGRGSLLRHRRIAGRPRRRGPQQRRRTAGLRSPERAGRRRGGLREVQGGRRQADRGGRRAEPLRSRRRVQGDGAPRRRDPRVRDRGARPETRVHLPLDDRHDPARARQPQRGHRRLHARPAVARPLEGAGGGPLLRDRRGVRGQEDDQAGARYFQRAARLIPSFRDVQDRVRRLTKVEPKQPVRAVAVGADDEFDRAFDDILGGGKLP